MDIIGRVVNVKLKLLAFYMPTTGCGGWWDYNIDKLLK